MKIHEVASNDILTELSNELLGKYKTAASASALAADKAGDYATGNKRFSGIVQATKKQFNNDAKKHVKEGEPEDKIETLARDIQYNWMSESEDELFTFLKANIDDTWMSYLKGLSDQELQDTITQAHYIAHNEAFESVSENEDDDGSEFADELYNAFEAQYPNLCAKAGQHIIGRAVMDFMNYEGQVAPENLVRELARTVRANMTRTEF